MSDLGYLLSDSVTYTHDSGLKIEVKWEIQEVRVPGGEVLGPFAPFDVDSTCAAISGFANQSERYGLLRAAYDWRRLNAEDPKDAKYLRRKYCNFEWD